MLSLILCDKRAINITTRKSERRKGRKELLGRLVAGLLQKTEDLFSGFLEKNDE